MILRINGMVVNKFDKVGTNGTTYFNVVVYDNGQRIIGVSKELYDKIELNKPITLDCNIFIPKGNFINIYVK